MNRPSGSLRGQPRSTSLTSFPRSGAGLDRTLTSIPRASPTCRSPNPRPWSATPSAPSGATGTAPRRASPKPPPSVNSSRRPDGPPARRRRRQASQREHGLALVDTVIACAIRAAERAHGFHDGLHDFAEQAGRLFTAVLAPGDRGLRASVAPARSTTSPVGGRDVHRARPGRPARCHCRAARVPSRPAARNRACAPGEPPPAPSAHQARSAGPSHRTVRADPPARHS